MHHIVRIVTIRAQRGHSGVYVNREAGLLLQIGSEPKSTSHLAAAGL